MRHPEPSLHRVICGIERKGPAYRVTRERSTRSWLLMVGTRGAGYFAGNGSTAVLDPGTVALIRPGTPHDYGTCPDARCWHFLWSHFHPWPHWSSLLQWPQEEQGVLVVPQPHPTEAESALAEALASTQRGGWLGEVAAMHALERLLISLKARLDADLAPPPVDEAIDRVLMALSQRLSDPWDAAQMAALASLSIPQFNRRFRAATGETPRNYLERLRLDRARILLEHTSHSIQAVSDAVGFASVYYFSGRFKAAVGVPPTTYRDRTTAGTLAPSSS